MKKYLKVKKFSRPKGAKIKKKWVFWELFLTTFLLKCSVGPAPSEVSDNTKLIGYIGNFKSVAMHLKPLRHCKQQCFTKHCKIQCLSTLHRN